MSSLIAQANSLELEGRYAEAEAVLLGAVREAPQTSAPGFNAALAWNNLGYVYENMRRCDDSRNSLLRSIRLWRDAGDTLRLIRSSNNLVSVYVECGEISAAARYWKTNIEPLLATLEPQSDERATLLAEGAAIRLAEKKYAKAEPLLAEAVAIWEGRNELNSTSLALTLSNRATARAYNGRVEEALADADRALRILRSHPEVTPQLVATVLNNAALACQTGNRQLEAEEYFKRGLAALDPTPDSPQVLALLRNYASMLRKAGRGGEAKKLDERANRVAQAYAAGIRRHTVDASEMSVLPRK